MNPQIIVRFGRFCIKSAQNFKFIFLNEFISVLDAYTLKISGIYSTFWIWYKTIVIFGLNPPKDLILSFWALEIVKQNIVFFNCQIWTKNDNKNCEIFLNSKSLRKMLKIDGNKSEIGWIVIRTSSKEVLPQMRIFCNFCS